MSRRHIFTERQRAALFDLPTDELSLLKFYTLGDDDLENIRQRRRPENRIGFALQLCALRYPGRALGHCCKVSDEAAFCLIQRPYISKTLLTRRISPRGSP
ncbi:DUF4158 domain-containing protein [Escherichia coli]|nr:DUF4158 domain-containing protein [Escherichia coli]